jgi:hypothetical protein
MSDIGEDPGPQNSDHSAADPATKGPDGVTEKDPSQAGDGGGGFSPFDRPRAEIFGSNFGGSCYGFPELTDRNNTSPFNADADLRNKKDLAEGAFKLLTGEEPTASGVYHFLTGKPSATEVAIGVGVGVGGLLFGLPGAAAATEGSELVLGTDALAGVGAFVRQVKNAAEAGAIASEAAGLYEKIKTRVEGLAQFNDAARDLSRSQASDDHTPGEMRTKQNRVRP